MAARPDESTEGASSRPARHALIDPPVDSNRLPFRRRYFQLVPELTEFEAGNADFERFHGFQFGLEDIAVRDGDTFARLVNTAKQA